MLNLRTHPVRHRARLRMSIACVALTLIASAALADWLQPDPSYRDALQNLRYATRDTIGHADDAPRLDTLAVALLRLGRYADATAIFQRVLAARPGDAAALAALGKLAMFQDRNVQAESLLSLAGQADGARADLYMTRLRRGDWKGASALAEEVGDLGRIPLLEHLGEGESFVVGGAERAEVPFERTWPAPIVRVKLNGTVVLMAVDTGAPGLLLDPSTLRVNRVARVGGQRVVTWDGSRVAVGNAMVQKIEIGGVSLANVPAGTVSLHKYSLGANPQSAYVAGILGADVLRRFDVTLDFKRNSIALRRAGGLVPAGTRVPFERWGEDELMVWGSINGGRRMALMLATGLAETGVAAPQGVMEEVGIKPGGISKYVKGAGSWLQGSAWAPVTVPTLTIGAVAADRLPGWSGAMDAAELWRHGVRRDGLVGPGFFRGRRVTFDWAGSALVFED